MAGELCPYCGTLLTTSLRFCVTCRRSVTEDKIRQAGARQSSSEEDDDGQEKFRLSRRTSYEGVRQVRTFFLTLTTLLVIAFVYYFVMKFVVHEPIPFEDKVVPIIDKLMGRSSYDNQAPPAPPTQSPAAPESAQPGSTGSNWHPDQPAQKP
jgi:hypothetical protein